MSGLDSLFLGLVLVARAGDPSAPPGPSLLVDAPVDDDPAHAWSVGICSTDDGACTRRSGSCSGTLVAPNLVLTARHCVDRGMQAGAEFCDSRFLDLNFPARLFFTVDPDPFGPDAAPEWIAGDRVLVPENRNLCQSDIALVILSSSVPAEVATPVWVDVDRNLALDPIDAVAIVARGAVEVRLEELAPGSYYPEVADDGHYRRRVLEDIPVLCVSDEEGACVVDDVTDPSGSFSYVSNTLVIDGVVLPGDSGSAMVEQSSFAGGAPRVVAVNTLGTFSELTTGDPNTSGGQRVSRHRDFLVAGALEAAALAGVDPPGWATGAPPPEIPPRDRRHGRPADRTRARRGSGRAQRAAHGRAGLRVRQRRRGNRSGGVRAAPRHRCRAPTDAAGVRYVRVSDLRPSHRSSPHATSRPSA